MRWKPGILGAAFTLASTLAFSAECRRDLSGEWSRETAPGATADEAYRAEGSGWSDRIRVIQDGGRITIESLFFSRGDMQPPLRFSYLPGDSATENVVRVGQGVQLQASMARWSDDCRLVITTRHVVDDDVSLQVTVTQILWLESATALVVETARGRANPNRTVYRRVAVTGGV